MTGEIVDYKLYFRNPDRVDETLRKPIVQNEVESDLLTDVNPLAPHVSPGHAARAWAGVRRQ